MKRYLALDAIQPGDVILSAEPTLRSIAIRLVTGSLSSSHVAIAIHPLIWFEAVGEGLRYRILEPELVWSGERLRFALPWPKGTRFKVRRPETPLPLEGGSAARSMSAKRLIDATSRFAFLDYAPAEAFLPLLRLGFGDSKLFERLARILSRDRFRTFSGPFCSWLVAACYEAMGDRKFDLAANRITPAAISRSQRFHTIDATVHGVPIEDRPAFRIPVSHLRSSLALAAAGIASAREGAQFAKVIARANHGFGLLLRSGWRNLGRRLPWASAAALRSIEQDQLRTFEEFQQRLVESLELAYSSLETHAVGLPEIAA